MAKSYYILESKKVNGTIDRDTSWEVKLTSKNVTEGVAELFYEYLAEEMGTVAYFKVSNEIQALRTANKTSRQTALGLLAGKVGSFEILIGYVDHATKTLNNDLIEDVEQGKNGLSKEEYNEFYAGVKVKPENSHWLYFKAKTFAQENNIPLAPFKKTTTVQSNEEVVPVDAGVVVNNSNPDEVVVNNGNPDGVVVTSGNPDGVVTSGNPDGVVVTSGNPDGVVTSGNPDGVVVTSGNPDGVVVTSGNPDGVVVTSGNPDEVVVPTGDPVVTPKPQDTNPKEREDAAKYNPTAGFMRQHVSAIGTIMLLATIAALAFTPGTFWATSLLSLLAINLGYWATSFSIMTFVPGIRHAIQRDALRAKIDKCATKSNSHVSNYNNNMNVALSQAGVTFCDLQIATMGEGADKETAMRKVKTALASCNKSKVLRAIENSKAELQNAINQLYSTNSKGVAVGALRHQEELYDRINARRNAYERAGRTAKVQKYDRMPVPVLNYIATYIRCEQAVIEINKKIEMLNQCGFEVQKPNFENWNTVKEKTRRYYAGALNAYYEDYHYERDGKPLRINAAGERIKPIESFEEIVEDVLDATGNGGVVPHNDEILDSDDIVVTDVISDGSGNDGM